MTAIEPPILPPAALGVLGSGQLGRMFTLAAKRMGYRVHVFSPESDSPAGQVADREWVGDYADLETVRAFARSVQVVTFEFENVPAATAAACAECTRVRPAGEVLHITQHRLREKRFLAGAGLPVTPFAAVETLADVSAGMALLGGPAILKTAAFGYDGKGQQRVATTAEAGAAWLAGGQRPSILEAVVDFDCEASVVAARGGDGTVADFGVIQNEHQAHILNISLAPAPLPPRVTRAAVDLAHTTLRALEVVGVLCVELFLTRAGEWLINELAPRPHNSGHLTIEACPASQFEQQVRTICGLPLGTTEFLRPAAMANLLGDVWQAGEPDWPAALAVPGVSLHLYGKQAARPGRKMGHLTALANTTAEARARVLQARALLQHHSLESATGATDDPTADA